MATRSELAVEEREKYEYRLDVVLTLAQARALRSAIERADTDLLDGLWSSLSKGIEYAYEYCSDVALKRSITEGE